MATTQDLVYRVTVNDSQLDRLIAKTASLNSTLYSSTAALKPLDAQLRGMGRRTVEIGRYLTRNVSVPLAAAGALATKLAYDFDKSFSKIATLVQADEAEMNKLRSSVMGLAKESPTSAKELAEALYFIRSSGFDANESLALLEQANKAAVSGLGDVKTVADAVTTAMNAYGHSVLSAENATDILLATVRVGKAEPADLARSIGRVIPIANQLGVSFKDVGGAIATMTLQGLSADLAVTGLRALFTTFAKILQPTAQGLAKIGLTGNAVTKALGEQGLSATLNGIRARVDDFVKKGGQVSTDTLEEIRSGSDEGAKAVAKLETKVGTTAASLLAKLFPNVKALNAFLIITAREGAQAADVFGQVADSAGETAKDWNRVKEQRWFKLATALNRVKTEITEIGYALMPTVTVIAEIAGELLGAFSALPRPVKLIGGQLLLITALLGPLLIMFGNLVRISSAYVLRRGKQAKAVQTAAGLEAAAIEGTGVAATVAGAQAAKASVQTVKGAELATAAYKIESMQVRLLAAEEVRRARIVDLVSRKRLIGGGVGLYRKGAYEGAERGPAGSITAGMQGPGGAPIFFRNIRPNIQSVGRLTRAMGMLRGSLVGVVGGLGAIASFVWPIALIEGTFLLAQNWGTVSLNIYNASQRLDEFLDKLPGTRGKDSKNIFERVTGHIGSHVKLPDELKTFMKWTSFGLFGKAIDDGREKTKKAAEEAKKHGDQTKKSKDYVAQMAKFYGVSVAEMRQMLGLSAGIGKNLEEAADKLRDAFGQLTSDVMDAFDAVTERLVSNLRVSVTALGRTFTIGQEGLTPAERELKALDKVREKRDLMEAIEDARERVREARGRKLVEVRKGRYLMSYYTPGDPKELKQARRDLRNANEDLRRYGLEQRAEVERKAADKALAQAELNLRARRDLQQRHFQKELEALEAALAKGEMTEKQARARMTQILKDYGVDVQQAGHDLGTAFATGLSESLAAVFTLFAAVRAAAVGTAAQTKKVLMPKPGTSKGALPEAYTHLYQAQPAVPVLVATPPAAMAAPPGMAPKGGVVIQNMWVTSPAVAELVATTIARKVSRR